MRNLPPVPRVKSTRSRMLVPAMIIFIFLQIFLIQIVVTMKTSIDFYSLAKQHGKPIAALVPDQKQSSSENAPQDVVPAQGAAPAASLPSGQDILSCIPNAGKRVAITFDDGPSLRYTPEYLHVLRENRVPATFFLTGRNAQQIPNIVGLIAMEGHEIGNHTYDHRNLATLNETAVEHQISSTSEILTKAIQQEIKYFRPPGGNNSQTVKKVTSKMNMQIVMWNVDPWDWEKNKTANQIVASIKQQLEPGSIILLHEGKPQTLTALPILINELQQDGWKFVTISGLLNYSQGAAGTGKA